MLRPFNRMSTLFFPWAVRIILVLPGTSWFFCLVYMVTITSQSKILVLH